MENMKYKHLTAEQRYMIEIRLKSGHSKKQIAEEVGCNISTIYREISRNSVNGHYISSCAQNRASLRFKALKNRLKFNATVAQHILDKIKWHWSPEQIVNYFRLQGKAFICHKTVYRWIRIGLLSNVVQFLRRKGRAYKRLSDKNIMRGGKSIHDRPQEANERQELGHWELDTVYSPRGHKTAIVTIVDRKTRLLKAQIVPNRTAHVVSEAIYKLLKFENVKTLTADNGKEFSYHKKIERDLETQLYFADPYCSWQRGTNENTNGLLREFIPKGTDIADVTEDDLHYYTTLINTRPRKVLNWRTAQSCHYSN